MKRTGLECLAPHGMGYPADCCAWCGKRRPPEKLILVSWGAHPTIPGEVRKVGFCSRQCQIYDARMWGSPIKPIRARWQIRLEQEARKSQPLEQHTALENHNP